PPAMSLRFSMYGTRPSKNVPRSCASSVGVSPAAADAGASDGVADVAGCATDVAGAGGVATADGTCARQGAHTPMASSSEARRFNMTCLPWRMGREPDCVAANGRHGPAGTSCAACDGQPSLPARAASVLQKFLLTEIPNMRGVMIVAVSSIMPVTGLGSPATGT